MEPSGGGRAGVPSRWVAEPGEGYVSESTPSDGLARLFVSHAWRQVVRRLGLTAKEDELLRLVLMGHSEKQAASSVGCSVRAIHARKERLHQRLNVRSTAELVARVLEALSPLWD